MDCHSKSGYAIADGSLQIVHNDGGSLDDETDEMEKAVWSHMNDVTRTLLEKIRQDLGIWPLGR